MQLGATGLAVSVRGAEPGDALSRFQHCVSSHLALDAIRHSWRLLPRPSAEAHIGTPPNPVHDVNRLLSD